MSLWKNKDSKLVRALWSAAWRIDCIRGAAKYPNNPGRHRFAGPRCLCGQTYQSDPVLCPIWGKERRRNG